MPEHPVVRLGELLSDAQGIVARLPSREDGDVRGHGYLAPPVDEAVASALDELAGHEGPITVFVGAGASMESGLPSWTTLVRRLLLGSAHQLDDDQALVWADGVLADGPLAAAAVAEALIDADSPSFPTRLRAALYGGLSPRQFGPGALAQQLADLQVARGEDLRLLTFNYDRLLERAIEDRGMPTRSYVRARTAPDGHAAVWHLHGQIAQTASGAWATPGRLVLGEAAYAQSTTTSWPQDYVRRCLQDSACLFVGLSMSDPNLIRWLHLAEATTHPRLAIFVRQDSPAPNDAIRDATERSARRRWEAVGVDPVWVRYRGEVAQVVFELRRRLVDVGAHPPAPSTAAILARGRRAVVPAGGGFAPTQDRVSGWLRHLVGQVETLCRFFGVEVQDDDIGLGLWGVDHGAGAVELWALSHRALRATLAIDRYPVHAGSPWAAVQAVVAGTAVEETPGSYASRWGLVRGIPVILDHGARRTVAGVVTLTSLQGPHTSPLARERAPAGLLTAVDGLLSEAAADWFEDAVQRDMVDA